MPKKKRDFLIVCFLLISITGWLIWEGSTVQRDANRLSIDEMVTLTFSAQTLTALPKAMISTVTAEAVRNDPTLTATLSPTVTPLPVKYSFLREWKVAGAPRGYGADILLEDAVSPEELVKFVIRLAGEEDPVSIRVWSSLAAYRTQDETTPEFQSGFILVYTRQTVAAGSMSDANQIEWKQQTGEYADFYGQTLQIVTP